MIRVQIVTDEELWNKVQALLLSRIILTNPIYSNGELKSSSMTVNPLLMCDWLNIATFSRDLFYVSIMF